MMPPWCRDTKIPQLIDVVVARNLDTSVTTWDTLHMSDHKSMTIRLDADLADRLETVASVDEKAISDVIRAAISEHIVSRQKDPEFRDGLQARIERDRRLLK
jgi:predicted transcriptional regulator